MFLHIPPSQLSNVQRSPSSQSITVPLQLPLLQTSPVVQAFPSSQAVPLLTSINTHPVLGSQESTVQGLLSLQTIGDPATHFPLLQTSSIVQAFPSSQELLLNVNVHPLSGSQESVVQGLLSLQTIGDPATQLPLLQTSPVVQAFPSSQAVPLLTSINTHPVSGSQESTVQGLLSLQAIGVPIQLPLLQTSPVVQAFPSSQAVPLLT